MKTAFEDPESLYKDERGTIFGEMSGIYSKNGDRHDVEECHVIEDCHGIEKRHVIRVTSTGKGMTGGSKRKFFGGKAVTSCSKSVDAGWRTPTVLGLIAARGGRLEIEAKPEVGSELGPNLPIETALAPANADVL